MNPPASSHQPEARLGHVLTIGSLAVAAAWLVSRVFVGLDLTDEMQYYGEIAGMVRTGRFFHDDLFVQQLGYIFVYPFFKLHALLFPDLSYFVVFGRLLYLSAYGVVGALFWRCASRAGGFSTVARLAALAIFAAWIPFQLFAFSYNSWAYLLLVALLSIWLVREQLGFARYAFSCGVMLAMLCVAYPPAGPVMIVVAAAEVASRAGVRRALMFLGCTCGCGLAVAALIIGFHGADFFTELGVSLRFSRTWGVAHAFLQDNQPQTLAAVVAFCGLLIIRLARKTPATAPAATAARSRQRAVAATAAVGALVALLVMSTEWSTGFFATAAFVTLAALLAVISEPAADRAPAKLVAVGTILGVLFGVTGGDGFHNFGIGAIGVVPVLALYAAREFAAPNRLPALLHASVMPAFALLLVLNGALHPYREAKPWDGLQKVTTVPAFKGIWTARVKVAAFGMFDQLSPMGAFRGKRILVTGPHAWLYFATGGDPSTPMIFMHFTGTKESYELIAERLFIRGKPDAIFATNFVPQIVADKIAEWSAGGQSVTRMAMPPAFLVHFKKMVQYDFAPEVFLVTRPPLTPSG